MRERLPVGVPYVLHRGIIANADPEMTFTVMQTACTQAVRPFAASCAMLLRSSGINMANVTPPNILLEKGEQSDQWLLRLQTDEHFYPECRGGHLLEEGTKTTGSTSVACTCLPSRLRTTQCAPTIHPAYPPTLCATRFIGVGITKSICTKTAAMFR
jgi:hypothetical protein